MNYKSIIFLIILFTLTFSVSIRAEDSSAVEAIKQSECMRSTAEGNDWLDITHQYINESFCEPVVWFDSFFGSDRIDEEVRPGSHVRWTNDFIQTEGTGFEYVTKVRASIKLPKASERLKLVFEGEQEGAIEDVIPATEEDVKTDVGLLYELFQSQRSNINIKINLSPEISLRYRYAYPFTETLLTRFTQTFYQTDEDIGNQSRLDLEKRMNENLLLRWTNITEDSQLIAGAERTSALVLFQKLSKISALSYESSVTSRTIPEAYNTNARLAIRYRRNFYKKWLFYELVPEVTWPREFIADERIQVGAFMFRLEINFINM